MQPRQVTIVGAGAVGVSCAMRLQADGHRVTIFDPRPPGTATSFGNAGVIANGAVAPVSMPGLWRQVPKMLCDPLGPLRIRPAYLPKLAPWLWRFLRAGAPARVKALSQALAPLVMSAYEAHAEQLRLCRVENIVHRVGWFKVYETDAAFAATAMDRDLMTRHGVRFEILKEDEIRQLEPGLAPIFRHGIFQPDAGFVSSPHRLVCGWAEHVLANGGEIRAEKVTRIEIGPERSMELVTEAGRYPCDVLVIAAGAWSKSLAAQLGSPVPLDAERGYHLNLPTYDGSGLRRPTVIGDNSFVLAPMEDGVRLTSGVELAGLDAPPDYTAIRRLLPAARRALPGLGHEVNREWLGFRPSLPDSLPVIGPSPYHPSVFFAFGHGHLGLTLGPITGRLIADLVAGRSTPFDVTSFRPDRF